MDISKQYGEVEISSDVVNLNVASDLKDYIDPDMFKERSQQLSPEVVFQNEQEIASLINI